MTMFELVKIALDDLYGQGEDKYGAKLDAIVKDKMLYLSEAYKNLRDEHREPLDYKDPATRLAYVYSYVASHADYMVQVFEKLRRREGKCVFSENHLRVSCVGGGPGSDFLAMLKFLSEYNESVEKITCYLLDREQAWADTWTELDDSLSSEINLKTNFQMLDVTKKASWEYQTNFKKADVFTFSFFISEVYNIGNGAPASFFSEVIRDSKPGAYFVYVDNGHEVFNSYFDNLCNASGLELIVSETDTPMIPRFTEQADTLKQYTDRFGRMPKLRSYLSYRVLRKT